MSFALDFKSKFPLKLSSTAASSSGFSRRTFGIYSETKAIHEGRHDLTVEVWAVDGELGVGPPRKEEIGADGVAKWRREGARLVGVSTQVRWNTPYSTTLCAIPVQLADYLACYTDGAVPLDRGQSQPGQDASDRGRRAGLDSKASQAVDL